MTKKIIFPTYRNEQQIKFQKMSLLALNTSLQDIKSFCFADGCILITVLNGKL